MKELKFEINEEFGTEIISEGGNSFIGVRKISWNGRGEKVDIRKYMVNSEGNEIMGKGVGLTDEETDTLVDTLVDKGYGNPIHIINSYAEKRNVEAIGAMHKELSKLDPEFVNQCFEKIPEDDDTDSGFDASSLFDEEVEDDE